LVAAAGFVAVGNVMIVAAYRRADFSVIAPFRYSIVVFSLVVGFFVFGERPDALALTGAAMIAASGLYTVHRERIRSKERGAAS
jgi:drug/metabolite transporter (DMT)-like permease